MGTCALGNGVLKERRFLHAGKPLTCGIRGGFGTSEGSAVQQDRCSKGKMRKFTTEIQPKSTSQLSSGSSALLGPQWVAASCQRPGFRSQTSERGPVLTATEILWGKPGKLSICQRNKGSFLQEGSSATLWFCTLTEQGTPPKQMLKGGELLMVCSPRDKEIGMVPEVEGRKPLWTQHQRSKLLPSCECHYPHLPGNLRGLALQRVPQPGTDGPGEAHDLLQTGATPAQPRCSDHSLHTSAQLSKWAWIHCCFHPLMSGQWTDTGERLKSKGGPKPEQNARGCVSKGKMGKLS